MQKLGYLNTLEALNPKSLPFDKCLFCSMLLQISKEHI